MKTASWWSYAVAALATGVVSYGWLVAVDQLSAAGWVDGGTAWLFVFVAVATVGAAAALVGVRTGRHSLAAVGLLVAAVLTPTGFGYPMNALLLIAAAAEAWAALRSGHRSGRRPPTRAPGRPGPTSPPCARMR